MLVEWRYSQGGASSTEIYRATHRTPTMVVVHRFGCTGGFRLARHEPPDERRRGLSRPPWLSARDAYRGVGNSPPQRHGVRDGRGPSWEDSPGDSQPSAGDEAWEQQSRRHRARHAGPELQSLESDCGSDDLVCDDPPTGDVVEADVGRTDGDYRAERSDPTPEELEAQRFSLDSGGPSEPSADRTSVPPWEIPARIMPSDYGHAASDEGDPTRGSGFPPAGAPLPPPPVPGWPPAAPPPPAWWFPPGSPGWPPFPPGALPPGYGYDVQSPLAHSQPIAPPAVRPAQTFRMPPSLDEAKVANPRKDAPRSGWRRAVHRATGGYFNPGDSRKDRAEDDLLSQIRQPIVGDFRIAVLSIKGGVGKTTTTLGLGSALATVRRDRVIAVDANPDRGTLAERVRDVSTSSTVRDLLTDPNIKRYADVRGHTRMAVSRLEVLASEQDPAAADVFNEADYRRTIGILGHYYNVILTDCGTGIMHSAMAGVLDLAHSIVLVSQPAMDAVRSASATLDWLMQHGYSSLVREGHVVLSAARPGPAALKLDKVREFFEARCRSIHSIPFDPHLAEGADVDFEMLKPPTRRSYLELAGAVAENFPRLHAGQS